MSDDNHVEEAAIIQAGYAERVRDAFKTFAESLGMGEQPKASQERFMRAIELTRKARDMALQALADGSLIAHEEHERPEGAAAQSAAAQPAAAAAAAAAAMDGLSAEDQAMIQLVLDGTRGGGH